MTRQTRLLLYLFITLILFGVWQYYISNKKENTAVTQTTIFIPDKQTKFLDCVINGKYPDHACTPGAIFTTATKEQVCTSGYSKSVRDVPESVKKAVYAEYNITHHSTGEYEVDHFISLELGGSNDTSNLFPESADPRPGFHEKDKVENYLHDQVCSGKMTLNEAQREISSDWYEVFSKIY